MRRPITTIAFAVAVALVGQTSLLVFAFNGHPWQVEMHFYYFAVLAMLSGFCDWRVLVTAAGLIALHHAGLNIVLPDAVYPGGTNYIRVAVHAIAVVIETAMLVFIGLTIRRAFAAVDEARHLAEDSAEELERFASQQTVNLEQTTTARRPHRRVARAVQGRDGGLRDDPSHRGHDLAERIPPSSASPPRAPAHRL